MPFKPDTYKPEVIKDFSALEARVNKSIKNDYQIGYDEGIKPNALHRGSTKLYNDGFEAGRAMRGKL